MRISDWSSDLCSSDLARRRPARGCRRHGQHARARQGRAMTPAQQTAAMFLLGLAGAGAPAFAQSGTRTAPAQASIDACALVEVDADRLACYDRVAGRRTLDPAQADAAAALARQIGSAHV